ncbi:mRNA capping factor [Lithospermum erythrorhizon]|uniref:mRNA capping factor n=1 Tax=Lithospermum erythrorhizon TaxID=34254 RepID=A0AAV3R6E1_LITER
MTSSTAQSAGGGGGGGKLTPYLDEESTKMLNLTVLQRTDPFIEEILITAAHVTFYEFNIDLNQWSRKDVEGSLFVVKRNAQPRFQFIVMNRRSTENLIEDLLGDFEYELQIPYLLYRNAAQEVNGIWFYNSRECEEVANLFSRILSAYAKVPPKPQVASSKSEFEELEAVPTSAVIEGPLEPSYPSSDTRDLPEDSSFMNFFSSAMNIGNSSSNSVNLGQRYQASGPAIPLSSHPSLVLPSQPPLAKTPSLAILAPLSPSFPRHDVSDTALNNRVADLVKPSTFLVPSSSSTFLTPPISSTLPTSALHPLDMQRPHGTPLLQPFPPPTPPPSLTPNSNSAPSYGPLTRQNVREALLNLVQDNQFIEMFYQALQKGHQ